MSSAQRPRPSHGLSLYPTASPQRLREFALRAEELGYENLWFGDSQNIWREAYVSMAAAAVGRSRIVFGTGVTNGVTRHRSVIAAALATLHELTDGRVAAGFGVGDSALRTMGRRAMRVAELDDLIVDLRALWRGDEVKEAQAEAPFRLSYLEAPLTIPIYVAASGPKLLDLAGRAADGVILLVGTEPAAIRAALAKVAEGADSVGRSLDHIHVVLWAPVALDRDPAVARERVRAHVARTVLRPIDIDLSASERVAVDRIREKYDYYDHMVAGSAHAQLVPDEIVGRLALAGTPTDCSAQMDALGEAGVHQIAMIPFPGADQPLDRLLEDFAAL